MAADIHRITPANMGLLEKIAGDVFDEAIEPAFLQRYLADPGHALLVAVDGGLVVGQIRGIVHLQPDRASDLYIDNLGVSPAHQRQGIATRLVSALVAWGKAHGCTYVWVATEPDNDSGVPFYKAQRFTGKTLAWFESEIGG